MWCVWSGRDSWLVIYVWTASGVSLSGLCWSLHINWELTWNLIRFPVRVFITQIADHAQQQPAREQYQPAPALLSPGSADDGGRQSCDIHPSLSSLNTLPSMWQRRITSHSHQLECSRHPFINIQHTIFIKFQTFRKILNIISSSDGLFENSKYDIGSLLSVNCMSQPVQLKGCPVLLKFTYSDPVCFTDNTQDWLCVFFQLTFIRRFHNAEILFDKLLHLWVIWHEQVSTALTYDILMKANLQTEPLCGLCLRAAHVIWRWEWQWQCIRLWVMRDTGYIRHHYDSIYHCLSFFWPHWNYFHSYRDQQ